MSLKNRITAAASRALYSAFNFAGVQIPPIQYDFVNYEGKDVYSRDAAKLEAYYSNAYRACMLAKARPLAALPVHVYDRDGGVRKPTTKRAAKDLENLLRTKWNPLMSTQECIRWLNMTKDLKGEAFVRVEWRNARIVALWPMSGTPGIEIIRGGSHVFNYGGDKFTAPGRYLENEIVWVKSPILDSDCLHGRSLAELAANEVGLSVDLERFYSHILNGEGNFPGWLETDQTLKEQDYQKLKTRLEDGGGLVNSGKVRIFDHGLQYKSTPPDHGGYVPSAAGAVDSTAGLPNAFSAPAGGIRPFKRHLFQYRAGRSQLRQQDPYARVYRDRERFQQRTLEHRP